MRAIHFQWLERALQSLVGEGGEARVPTRRAVGVAEAKRQDAHSTEAVPAARRLVGLAQHQVADGALALHCFGRRLDEVAIVASLPVDSLSVSLGTGLRKHVLR